MFPIVEHYFNGKITPQDELLSIIPPQKVFVGSLNGFPVVLSAWRPSKEDIESIVAGGAIYLQMFASPNNIPPAIIFTKDENNEINT